MVTDHIFYLYLKSRLKREGEARVSITGSLPRRLEQPEMPSPKLGASSRSPMLASQGLWPCFTAFPGTLVQSWTGSGATGTQTGAHMDVR